MIKGMKDTYQIHKIVYHIVKIAFVISTINSSIDKLGRLSSELMEKLAEANKD